MYRTHRNGLHYHTSVLFWGMGSAKRLSSQLLLNYCTFLTSIPLITRLIKIQKQFIPRIRDCVPIAIIYSDYGTFGNIYATKWCWTFQGWAFLGGRLQHKYIHGDLCLTFFLTFEYFWVVICCFLTFCSLSYNQISDEGACKFAGALQMNQSLQELKWVSGGWLQHIHSWRFMIDLPFWHSMALVWTRSQFKVLKWVQPYSCFSSTPEFYLLEIYC